jgi:hypothetical protein
MDKLEQEKLIPCLGRALKSAAYLANLISKGFSHV